MKKKSDLVSSVFWLMFSVFICIESYLLGLGNLRQPGPGFLFFWVSVALGCMSTINLIRAGMIKKGGEKEVSAFAGQNILKIVFVLISGFLFAYFMEKLGYILVTLLLFLFLIGFIEKKKWGFTLFVSVVVSGGAYLLFEIWLQSQLPKGLLGFLRF